MDNDISLKKESLQFIVDKIQSSGVEFPDIRERSWSKKDCDAARLLNLLVEAENIFLKLDDFQMNNGQCYPEIENMMLQIGEIRSKYLDFVDNHIEILDINNNK